MPISADQERSPCSVGFGSTWKPNWKVFTNCSIALGARYPAPIELRIVTEFESRSEAPILGLTTNSDCAVVGIVIVGPEAGLALQVGAKPGLVLHEDGRIHDLRRPDEVRADPGIGRVGAQRQAVPGAERPRESRVDPRLDRRVMILVRGEVVLRRVPGEERADLEQGLRGGDRRDRGAREEYLVPGIVAQELGRHLERQAVRAPVEEFLRLLVGVEGERIPLMSGRRQRLELDACHPDVILAILGVAVGALVSDEGAGPHRPELPCVLQLQSLRIQRVRRSSGSRTARHRRRNGPAPLWWAGCPPVW